MTHRALLALAGVALVAALAAGSSGDRDAFTPAPPPPPVYVLSVPGSKRPRDAVRARLSHVADVRFFDAGGPTRSERCPTLSPGQTGCALSHMALWQRLRASDVPVVICEDDVVLPPSFDADVAKVLAHVSSSTGGVDVVFLGHTAEQPGARVAEGLRRSVYPRGMFAYLVTPAGLRTLADWARTAVLDLPIDEELAGLIHAKRVAALSCFPQLASTRDEGHSLVNTAT